MAKLFLLRHLKSQWNKDDRFTGWVDAPLLEGQEKRAKSLARKIFRHKIDAIYCSKLFRNMDTVAEILEHDEKYPLFIHLDSGKMKKWGNFIDISNKDIPVYVSEKLNERYYGKLQGKDKEEMMKKWGKKRIHFWRRGFEAVPPGGESLRKTYKRMVPFYKKYVEKELRKGRNILIVASHNPLRALTKYIEKISNKDIANFEIAFGGLIIYQLDKNLKIKKKTIVKK